MLMDMITYYIKKNYDDYKKLKINKETYEWCGAHL